MMAVSVDGGSLAIGHRPKLKSLRTLAEEGFTHVVTLLSDREGAATIGRAAQAAGLGWIWIPLASAAPDDEPDTLDAVRVAFGEIEQALQSGGKVFLHCSAGIHRTGMITNAFLRYLGYDRQKARTILCSLRELTANEVGEARLEWGEHFARPDKRPGGTVESRA